VCKEKIKQAYGLAYQQALNASDAGTSGTATEDLMAREQLAREAGRRAEITTVRQLLGIPIDHFVEVTLAAFFQIAEVVQPLTVCLNEDTSDPYSGADFHRGVQQIDAAQAMAFVRQRRAVRDETFTDLDRTRRQQAFIASLMVAVRNSGVLSRPSALRNLVDVVEQNVAVDAGFDFAGFIKRGAKLTESGLSLYTLPIAGFGQTSAGEQINIIDVPTIRSIVRDLVSTGTPAAKPLAVLDVVNASSYEGLAAAVRDALAASSFTAGTASSADTRAQTSRIDYGPGAQAAAEALADQLNLTASASDTVAADRVRLTIGADFPADDYLTGTAEPSAVPTAAATATGTQAPVPTELSRMSATGGIPCVK
jgi:LCP family protein required for cell wall assembly